MHVHTFFPRPLVWTGRPRRGTPPQAERGQGPRQPNKKSVKKTVNNFRYKRNVCCVFYRAAPVWLVLANVPPGPVPALRLNRDSDDGLPQSGGGAKKKVTLQNSSGENTSKFLPLRLSYAVCREDPGPVSSLPGRGENDHVLGQKNNIMCQTAVCVLFLYHLRPAVRHVLPPLLREEEGVLPEHGPRRKPELLQAVLAPQLGHADEAEGGEGHGAEDEHQGAPECIVIWGGYV